MFRTIRGRWTGFFAISFGDLLRNLYVIDQVQMTPSVSTTFLGGLSLHLNHLIASCAANYDWPFGTLPFGLFGSNLDTRVLRHILGPILVIFEICPFLTIPGPFEYF